MKHETAAQLIREARGGDLAAFEQLIRLHERRVLLVALRLLNDRQDARDAVQEVFLRLHKHMGRFDTERELAPWLYRVTVNACRDIRKQRRRHTAEELGPREPAAPDADLDGAIGRDEQRRALSEALQKLPERERVAIVLRDIEGLATSEVARILGSSEGTVRSQVSSGRLKLRKLVRRWMGRQPL